MKDSQRKAMFAKLGKGARVESTQILGGTAKDIGKGWQGTVIDHFGGKKNPIIQFDRSPKSRNFVAENAVGIKLLKSSNKVPKRGQENVEFKGTKEQIIKMLEENGTFSNINNNDGWFSGSIYLDDGEGRTGDAYYRGKVTDGNVMVEMLKQDVPSFWRDSYYDHLHGDAVFKVKSALGIPQ